jgi:hypothetical protein
VLSNGTDGLVLARGGHQYFSCGYQKMTGGSTPITVVGERPMTVQHASDARASTTGPKTSFVKGIDS